MTGDWKKQLFARRIPLLVVLAGGAIWFGREWGGGNKTLHWRLPPERAEWRSLEVDLTNEQGQLLKREKFELGASDRPVLEQQLAMPKGRYTVDLYIEPKQLPPDSDKNRYHRQLWLTLADAETLELEIPR